MQQIYNWNELEEKMNRKKEMVLLKHSNTCPRSAKAYEECMLFEQNREVPVYYLVVQESRSFSNEIANRFQVMHQSPQIFYIKEGKVVWEAHHWDITEAKLTEAQKVADIG